MTWSKPDARDVPRRTSAEARSIHVARSRGRAGAKSTRPLLGWALATTIVLAALAGPPLTGQSIPALMELRHNILMIDWEFERLSIRTNTTETSTLGQDDLRRAESAQSKTQVRGGVL